MDQSTVEVAGSDSPAGSWKFEYTALEGGQLKLAIEEFRTEDVSIWLDQEHQRYYAIFHA